MTATEERTLADVLADLPVTEIPLQGSHDEDGEEFGVPDPNASREPRRRRGRPPKEAKPPKTPRARKALPPRRKGQFIEPLTQLYTGCGMMLLPVDPVCARAVITNAETCAKSLDDLAYQNEAVRRALFSITQTTAFGGVILAHMPIIIAVMAHHVPAAQDMLKSFGMTPPTPAEPDPETPFPS